MTWLDALILGIVEGLTEFLPVSSTGHLILTTSLLGIESEGVEPFLIVIQLGAILAVLSLYRQRVGQMINGLKGANASGLKLFSQLVVAFIPAAVVGLIFDDMIEAVLFYAVPVAIALIVGGVIMILVEQFYTKPRERDPNRKLKDVEDVTMLDALMIGIFQCFSLIPGTSRSMATIVGGQLRGLKTTAAAEFSFLLALPTLGAASLYKMVKDHERLLELDGGIPIILFGNVVAFIVAYFAVKYFVRFLTVFGMTPFGIYRIIIGIIFLSLALGGRIAMNS